MAEHTRPTMPAFKKANLWRAILHSLILFVIGAVCTLILAQRPAFSSSTVVIPVGLVLSIVLFVSSTVILWARNLNDCLADNGETLLRWLATHQAYLVEVWAAKTPPSVFEAMKHMPVDHRKWIIAKFMSMAIDGAFSDSGKRIEIPTISKGQYSELLSSLIAECKQEIRMSCPWTPTEWFQAITPTVCGVTCSPQLCALANPNLNLKTVRFHDHLHALSGNYRVPGEMRIRLVILKNGLEDVTSDKCYSAFCNLARHANLTQYYISLDNVESSETPALFWDKKRGTFKDVNVLDGIVVYWEPKSTNSDMGKCVMLVGGEEYDAVIRLLSSRTYLLHVLPSEGNGAAPIAVNAIAADETQNQTDSDGK